MDDSDELAVPTNGGQTGTPRRAYRKACAAGGTANQLTLPASGPALFSNLESQSDFSSFLSQSIRTFRYPDHTLTTP